MPGRRIILGGREVTVAKKRPGDGDVCRHTRYPDAVTLWSRSKFLLEEATAVALLLVAERISVRQGSQWPAFKMVEFFQLHGTSFL